MHDNIVGLDLRDGIAWVTMNRPKALNALNAEMTDALVKVIKPLEYDEDVRCIVVRGGAHFMAGGDLKTFHGMLEQSRQDNLVAFETFIHQVHGLIIAIRRMPKPVVASVSGACAGFGLSFMCAADLTIASDNSYYTLAYTLIGTSPDGGSTYALPRLVGLKKATELALLGDRFDAVTAKEYGLVNWVVPASDLEAETEKLASRLAAGPTVAFGRTKALLQRSMDNPLERQLQLEAESFSACAVEPDFAEGVNAFVEKRKVNFTGKA
ncbi:MAG: enoyl-CoA hydratase [Rhodospirillaceae bacterium]|nr:enoyl-CoA hydratase [Rhodospirillaceae bacterium]MCY4238950.1 enoyl-CoA hydratase [Rhodospirillaceae bacterium]